MLLGREDAGELLVLAILGGYACTATTEASLSIIFGVAGPEPATMVDVPEDLFSSVGDTLPSTDLERDRDLERRRGFSMSWGRPVSSSSSSMDARNRGSASGSFELRGESEGNATEAGCDEDLTIESISQN